MGSSDDRPEVAQNPHGSLWRLDAERTEGYRVLGRLDKKEAHRALPRYTRVAKWISRRKIQVVEANLNSMPHLRESYQFRHMSCALLPPFSRGDK